MKILITGGGGFVGRNLARLLPHFRHETIAPTHQELDMLDFRSYEAFLKKTKPDAIIHTAFKGHFGKQGDAEAFIDNIKMYESLWMADKGKPTIIFGSGAEFDRRLAIDNVREQKLFESWPVDLYGLSKNIIARRFMDCYANESEFHNPLLLRLFGCFGSDEPEYRFIKRSILRLKQGLPIEIVQDKYMDFIYIEDVAACVNKVLHLDEDFYRHMNLTYEKKYKLSDIAKIICNIMKVNENIVIQKPGLDLPYTGNGSLIAMENVDMYGLEQGIARMIFDLK